MAVSTNTYIESIKTIYKELFTVKLLHVGYGSPHPNFIAESVNLEPDEGTKNEFISHSMDYRFSNDTLICFMRTELLSPPASEPKVPYVKFLGDELIRFLINVSPDFLNKTDVVAAGAQNIYQFSNRVNAGTGGFICMHTAGVDNDDLKNVETVKAEKSCFGVIDIYCSGAMNSSYEIFDTVVNQHLLSPAYAIRFKSKV